MKFELSRASSETYFNYIKSILKYYTRDESQSIYNFLCESLACIMEETENKILDSVNMIELYIISKNMEKNNIKHDLDTNICNIRSKIQRFVFYDKNYSSEATKKYLYIMELWQKNDFIKDMLNDVYSHGKLSETANIFIRKTIIDSIICIGHFLNRIGIMDQLINHANYLNISNYLPKLMFELGESKEVTSFEIYHNKLQYRKITNPKTVMEMFTYDYLHTLNLSNLIFINLFWVNKLAKSYENLLAFLILLYGKEQLLYKIKDDSINFEDFRVLLEKASKQNYDKFTELFKMLYENDEKETNIKVLLPIYEALSVAYAHKNFCIFLALENEGIKEIKNYGIVRETINSNMVAYMWDIPNFNLPVSVHFSKEALIYYLKEFRKENRLRQYLFSTDFFGKNGSMPNAILFPLSKEDSQYVISKAKITNRNAHIAFMQNSKWPEHFKNSKGKIDKKYILLEDLK